ncbi:MAG: hypothetical protein AAF664_21355 [Planctomycetota bacterium]
MTIRFFGLLSICIAIAVLSLPHSADSILIRTGNEFDLAIVGRGNFRLIDADTVKCHYTRSGNLVLDENGCLAVEVDGKEWLIDPPIQVPTDWERLAVLPEGRVQILEHLKN